MNKLVQLLCLIILLSVSCKEKANYKPLSNLNPELSENYYEDLYKFFHAYPETQAQKDENAIIDYIAAKKLKPHRSESGLYYQIIEPGYGANLKMGDPVTVHYIGTYLNTEFFDSSYSRGKPIKFNVGDMIKGWNEALTYLKPASRAIIIIPSHLAYGDKGFKNIIPPNTPLVYEIGIQE